MFAILVCLCSNVRYYEEAGIVIGGFKSYEEAESFYDKNWPSLHARAYSDLHIFDDDYYDFHFNAKIIKCYSKNDF